MTGMLASVNSLAEARLVLQVGVDIIDLKQPEQGALGALSLADVKAIVADVNGRCPVSATIGDLPMQAELVYNAVKAMAETGVDYVKIGFFPGGDWLGTLDKLSGLTALNYRLIAVLFADIQPDFSILTAIKTAGFTGVMVDTMDKSGGTLTQLMSDNVITAFIKEAKEQSLLCGLAGSLRLVDVDLLMPYEPDYLGFRGALCQAHKRVGHLNISAVETIKNLMSKNNLTKYRLR